MVDKRVVDKSMIGEIWVPCKDFEGIIEVSNLGRVRSFDRVATFVRNGTVQTQKRRGQIISPCLTKSGYLEVSVAINGVRSKYLVHRLIARAFVPGYEEGFSVNHINGVKTDNRIPNLEWVTLARNTQHQWENGLVNLRGENQPSSKLTAKQVRIIRELFKMGVSPNMLSEIVDISSSELYNIKNGKRWNDLY